MYEGHRILDGDKRELIKGKLEGDIHTQTVKLGWMSRLQEAVRPILIPMLKGERITLHRKQQTILARWVAVNVMTAEYTDKNACSSNPADGPNFHQR
jgi:hypothetical protein